MSLWAYFSEPHSLIDTEVLFSGAQELFLCRSPPELFIKWRDATDSYLDKLDS